MTTDYYELLGVERSCTEDELKRAYRQRARELHPDSTGGDPEAERMFKETTIAYEVLRDPEKRRRYDMFGPDGAEAGAANNMGDVFGTDLGDLLGAFFGQGQRQRRARSGPMRGPDSETVLTLEFREAVFGTSKEMTIDTSVSCAECDGSGARPGTTATRCDDCEGTGEVRRVRQSILGQVVTAFPCNRCGGVGEVISSPCGVCHGDGRTMESRTFTVDIPAGVDNGSILRLGGRGSAGFRGGPPGDLFVHLSVSVDSNFERQGDDVVVTVPIAFSQAVLGASLTVQSLDGEEQIEVTPGTVTGNLLRMRGKGIPHVRGRGRGELRYQFVVVTPTDLTKEQEELLRRFAAERGEQVAAPGSGFFSKIRSAFG
ncbi:MAG: molecular chaperone DnaJ [Acidimicrobiales bacterium]